jgi:HEAT repeat protein
LLRNNQGMNPEDINELFLRTLSGNYEDDAPWDAVAALRRMGTREVFDQAAAWCQSDVPLKRARGADVLAQLRKAPDCKVNVFSEESYALLTELVQEESHPRPLASAIAALGHLDNPSAVPMIANFHAHPNAEVRYDVAFALGCFPDEPRSVQVLVRLMRDADEDVRDWATFGVGVLGNSDSTEIREALFVALADADEDVSEEALVGLAKRKDRRIVPMLLAELEKQEVGVRVIEAAYLMLDMQREHEGWNAPDYAGALRDRFPHEIT